MNSVGKAACSLGSPSAEGTKQVHSILSVDLYNPERVTSPVYRQSASPSFLLFAESSVFTVRGKAISRAFSKHQECKKN